MEDSTNLKSKNKTLQAQNSDLISKVTDLEVKMASRQTENDLQTKFNILLSEKEKELSDAKMKNEKKQSSSYIKLFVLSFLLVAGVSYFCFSKATEKMTGGSQCSATSTVTSTNGTNGNTGATSTRVAVNENVLTDLPDF